MSGMASPVRGVVSCEWRGYDNHAGMDIACPVGTRVYAAFAGTVREAGWNAEGTGRSGIGVRIENPDTESQYYGHLSQVLVHGGDRVQVGQLIALSGATGNVTGPHLHFECWAAGGTYYNGLDRNPRTYFAAHGITPGSATGQGTAASAKAYYPLAPETTKGVQRWLAGMGLYDRAIDGEMGPYTVKALQAALTRLAEL